MSRPYLFIFVIFNCCPGFILGNNIVAVVDAIKEGNSPLLKSTLVNKRLMEGWNGQIKIVIANDNATINALDQVCSYMEEGTFAMLDISSPPVGQLIRSFARATGMAYITVIDQTTLLPVDLDPDLHLAVEPPGSTMLKIISDIVKNETLTKIAILYDRAFDLHIIPKRILTGIPAQHLYQEIASTNASLWSQLLKLKQIDIKNFFVVGNVTNADRLLGVANQLDMMGEGYNWFVLNKGTKISCTLCRNDSSIISISGITSFDSKAKAEYVEFVKVDNKFFLPSSITIGDAFIYDVVSMIGKVFKSAPTTKPIHITGCYNVTDASVDIIKQSTRLIQALKNSTRNGVFGPIAYRDGMLKQNITLHLKRQTFKLGVSESEELMGNWTEKQGLKLKGESLIKTQGKKTYKVVVYPEYPPFIYKRYDANGKPVYEGYCLDLLNQIANITGFQYTLSESPDKLAGAMTDDGSWTGVINELIQKRADIAVGPLSVMAERENVVDFTVPYYDLVGLTILMKKPKFDYWIFKFVDVLEFDVWGGIIAAYFLFSGLLCIFDRSSPFSYQNNRHLWNGQGTEPRVFTFKEGVWFCMMSLTPQGGGEAPRALSGRLVAATWWLFGFIIIATYTANLAAFLTVKRLETSIKSLDDLSSQYEIQYAPMKDTSALIYFKRMAEIEERFYSIWKKMSLNDSLDPVERAKLAVWDYPVSNKYSKLWETMNNSKFPANLSEAISRVRTNEFAYIGDAEENRYQTLTNCDLIEVGEQFSRKPFAFAVQEGSPLRAQLSNAILQLLNQRALEQLKAKWWTKNENKINCPKVENESEGISIQHIGGVFIVIAMGTVLAFISLGFEYYFYKYRPVKESKNYRVEKSMSRAQLACTGVSSSSLPEIPDLPNGDTTSSWHNTTVEFPERKQNGHINAGFDLAERL